MKSRIRLYFGARNTTHALHTHPPTPFAPFVLLCPALRCAAICIFDTKIREEYKLLMKQNRNIAISGQDIYITHRCQVPQSCPDGSVSEVISVMLRYLPSHLSCLCVHALM